MARQHAVAVGNIDATRIEVDLMRGSVFGGITVTAIDGLAISGQVYSVPADVTTVRVGAQRRLR